MSTPNVSNQEAALLACLDAIALVNKVDFTIQEANIAMLDLRQAIKGFPLLNRLLKQVTKKGTLEFHVVRAYKLIESYFNGDNTTLNVLSIHDALVEALDCMQIESVEDKGLHD